LVVLVFTHRAFAGHVTPPGHPERVERLAAVEQGLAELAVERRECPPGAEADVLRCHPPGYLARVKSVGGICAAVDAVVAGEATTAFVAGRPPGHHAERETAMGFCLFGTVAIGAKWALDHHGLGRVAIVDFDVHHGNGTQDLLWDEGRCLFVSSHQMPLYPGTGRPEERGAHGQVLNVPLREGSGGNAMRDAYERLVFPALEAWEPELLLISAGFDAHAHDPLAGLMWQVEDYAWLTDRLCDFAGGRVVSTLEGGYDLDALAASVAAHVGVLEERGR
jgi:acetoin utilization deacetylase AcuC-like enzyme